MPRKGAGRSGRKRGRTRPVARPAKRTAARPATRPASRSASRPAARPAGRAPLEAGSPQAVSRRELLTQLAQQRSIEALHLMRSQGLSLAKAAAEAGTTPRTIQRHVGKALVQRDDGRYTATKYDRIPRRVVFTTPRGSIQLTVRDSRTVGRMAKYHAAVSDYLKTGDTRPLRAFRGKAIRVDKVAYPFITDPRTLERLAHAGEVTFEDFYALTTGEAK